jgi:hypothetical protein
LESVLQGEESANLVAVLVILLAAVMSNPEKAHAGSLNPNLSE